MGNFAKVAGDVLAMYIKPTVTVLLVDRQATSEQVKRPCHKVALAFISLLQLKDSGHSTWGGKSEVLNRLSHLFTPTLPHPLWGQKLMTE